MSPAKDGVRNVMLLASALYIGGAERVIANLAKHLSRERFRVTVCHLMGLGGIGEELVRLGYDVVGVEKARRGPGRYLTFRALGRILHQNRIDLVHTHTTYGLADASLCKLFGNGRFKLVHTFHFGNYPHCPKRYLLLDRVFSRAADRLIAVGIEQRSVVGKTFGLRPDRIETIVNGVEPSVPDRDPEWERRLRESGKVVIGTICTFIEQKGLPDLLLTADALCRQVPNAVFVVVGDGSLRAAIEQRCREMGLADRVLFAGWKDRAATTLLPLFDIFFQPSLWEAMSMVVLEAMAAGKPAVVTDVGDNRHVVLDGVTGYVVPRGDTKRMSETLRRLVESPEQRRAFGSAAFRRYENWYTVQAMTARYEDLYLRVLNGEHRSGGSSQA